MRCTPAAGSPLRAFLLLALTTLTGAPPVAAEESPDDGANAFIEALTRGPRSALGPYEDALVDPGFAREPNHPLDAYPFTSGYAATCPSPEERFRGACTSTAGYQAHEWGCPGAGAPCPIFRPFFDIQPMRVLYPLNPDMGLGSAGPLHPLGSTSLQEFSASSEPILTPHRERTLGSGVYAFQGRFGGWYDRPHAMDESVLLPVPPLKPGAPLGSVPTLDAHSSTKYSVGPDGWIGNIIETTRQYRHRGYDPESCRLGGVVAVREYALCHPYRDGSDADPHDYADSDEFQPHCRFKGSPNLVVRLDRFSDDYALPSAATPFILRDYRTNPWQDDWSSQPYLNAVCRESYIEAVDLLVLPGGNDAFTLRTRLELVASDKTLIDVDEYAAIGPPQEVCQVVCWW